MKNDEKQKLIAISNSKKIVSELKFVLNELEEHLESEDERKQEHGVIHSMALIECLSKYHATVVDIYNNLEKNAQGKLN